MYHLSQLLHDGVPDVSAAALFFIFFFGTFVSEDAVCLLAGSAAASGRISFALALLSCFLGIFVSDVLLYAVGRVFGERILDSRFINRLASKRTIAKASGWLEKNGAAAVFISRFVSGLRLPTYLLAGALRTDFLKFAIYFLLASAIWTPILVGSTAFSQTFIFPKNSILGFVLLVIVLRLILKYSSWKNRRFFVGRLKRIWNWEFWPLQVFYTPVVSYILWLSVKHRGLTIFAAANPAIPAGGFKGESKDEIYRGLQSSDPAADHLLRYTLLGAASPTDETLRRAWHFIEQNGLSYPLVLKPNAGERGKGVRIIRSESELETELLTAEVDLILQEFASGDEVSIFYYRHPTVERGRIFSITEKRFPVLTGDGLSTLEELILNDPRAVCIAEKYFRENSQRLEYVPMQGEPVQLIDIGTHSRGAIFLDGGRMKTALMEKKIDDICRGFDGFYFGRFDIRTRSFNDLMRGENFKIVELNGVTSESTNIYDPGYSLVDAYTILFRQWRIAFEIGAENIKLGAEESGVLHLLRLSFGRNVTPFARPPQCGHPATAD